MIDDYINCFKKYFKFKGRGSRQEYISFITIDFIINILVYFIPVLSSLYSIIAFVPSISVTSRRLHDVGVSFGYFIFPYFLIALYALPIAFNEGFVIENIINDVPKKTMFVLLFIYLFYQFVIFYWLFKKGDRKINKYGFPIEE